MNTKAVDDFIRSKFPTGNGNARFHDGIKVKSMVGTGDIVHPIKSRNSNKIDNYVMWFVREKDGKDILSFGVRIPDHSELGASKVGWQMRLKTLLDKSLEEFRAAIAKHDSGEQPLTKNISGYAPGGYDLI